MEVIITQPIRKFKIGEIVKVKNGYGRNFLIPKGFALPANEKNKQQFEEQKQQLSKKLEKETEITSKIIKDIEGKVLTFLLQALEDGKLFGSVRAKSISQQLAQEYNISLRSDQIDLSENITKIGIYTVKISLSHDINTQILVNVARNDSEASSQLTAFHTAQTEPKPEATLNAVGTV